MRRLPGLLLIAAALCGQIRVTLAQQDVNLTRTIFGRWAASKKTLYAVSLTNLNGTIPLVINEAAVGGEATSMGLRWEPHRLIRASMAQRVKSNPALITADTVQQSAFNTLLMAATGLVAIGQPAAAGVGFGAQVLPFVGRLVRGASPATLENLEGIAWPALVRLEPGQAVEAYLWTSPCSPAQYTYTTVIPLERLPGAPALRAISRATQLQPDLTPEEAAQALLSLTGRTSP